jgi:hypothetical protein
MVLSKVGAADALRLYVSASCSFMAAEGGFEK